MNHYEEQPPETVPLQAGMVADIHTGEVRSEVLEAHYAMLEDSMKTRRARHARKARLVKTAWRLIIIAPLVAGGVYFATSPAARSLAGEAVADLKLATDAEKLTETYDESLEKVAERNAMIEDNAVALGARLDAPEAAERKAQFNQEMSDFAGGARTAIDRDQQLREKFEDRDNSGKLRRPN